MKKSLLYRFFKIGKIPNNILNDLKQENIKLKDEGLAGVVKFDFYSDKNPKVIGKKSFKNRRLLILAKRCFVGFLVLTEKRIIGYSFGKKIISIDLSDNRLAKVERRVPEKDCLEFTFDANIFNANRRGILTIRFYTSLADEFYEGIKHKADMQLE